MGALLALSLKIVKLVCCYLVYTFFCVEHCFSHLNIDGGKLDVKIFFPMNITAV